MPGLGTAIVVDVPVDESLFDHVLKPAPGTPMKRQKMATLLASPFERTLFLDTDTLVIAPVFEVFDVLDRFDAAMALAPGYELSADPKSGVDRTLGGVPVAWPSWNSGVIAYVKTPAFRKLVERWDEIHNGGPPGSADQPGLRVASYESDARIVPLSWAYNYRTTFAFAVTGAVKILHGRDPELSYLARTINVSTRTRPTVPRRLRNRIIYFGDTALTASIKRRLRRWFGPR
jgi:hypothetical protein